MFLVYCTTFPCSSCYHPIASFPNGRSFIFHMPIFPEYLILPSQQSSNAISPQSPLLLPVFLATLFIWNAWECLKWFFSYIFDKIFKGKMSVIIFIANDSVYCAILGGVWFSSADSVGHYFVCLLILMN